MISVIVSVIWKDDDMSWNSNYLASKYTGEAYPFANDFVYGSHAIRSTIM